MSFLMMSHFHESCSINLTISPFIFRAAADNLPFTWRPPKTSNRKVKIIREEVFGDSRQEWRLDRDGRSFIGADIFSFPIPRQHKSAHHVPFMRGSTAHISWWSTVEPPSPLPGNALSFSHVNTCISWGAFPRLNPLDDHTRPRNTSSREVNRGR